MARRALFALPLLAAASCSGIGDVEIRPQATALAPGQKPASFRVSEARSHFALGSIALAAEAFRRALREDPQSVDALNGLAACYDRMGRFDLARDHYERALAIAPDDLRLYANLATSLALQGRQVEARRVRAELASRRSGTQVTSVTLGAPIAAGPADSDGASAAASISVPLSPAQRRPAALAAAEGAADGPELQRTGMAEVLLVTRPRSAIATLKQAGSGAGGTLAARGGVTLLNAARVSRLAATTRTQLHALGWRSVVIGDAPRTQATSSISYPLSRRAEAQRLARQLGLVLEPDGEASSERMVVRLGLDAARRRLPA
ncbi:LytR C-terminal domain-containing protein [Sphingomonas swuensis]|uniref:LytR C-terminal domain-containing protein n=1 Tax=Sphingomonas swuensis TaxID=977800 RepID=UPI0031D009C4